MKTLVIHVDQAADLPDLECLERIWQRVRLNELVKFQGKVYRRIVPKKNKALRYPYHFWCLSQDIYAGSCLTEDADGECVNIICNYKLVIEPEGETEGAEKV